ncbi:MAG: MOSC domain-containing protein, partial [Thermoanaerobaculia bacterium]|nr:MOSC domain-containing protein [Thermoanaerobaculia bacterium]
MLHDGLDRAGLEAMVALPALATSWRNTIARRLETGVCG